MHILEQVNLNIIPNLSVVEQYLAQYNPKYSLQIPNFQFFKTNIQQLIQQQQQYLQFSVKEQIQLTKFRGFSSRHLLNFNKFRQLFTIIKRIQNFDFQQLSENYQTLFPADEQFITITDSNRIKFYQILLSLCNILQKTQKIEYLIRNIYDESLLQMQSNQMIPQNIYMMCKCAELLEFSKGIGLQSNLTQILQNILQIDQLEIKGNVNIHYQIFHQIIKHQEKQQKVKQIKNEVLGLKWIARIHKIQQYQKNQLKDNGGELFLYCTNFQTKYDIPHLLSSIEQVNKNKEQLQYEDVIKIIHDIQQLYTREKEILHIVEVYCHQLFNNNQSNFINVFMEVLFDKQPSNNIQLPIFNQSTLNEETTVQFPEFRAPKLKYSEQRKCVVTQFLYNQQNQTISMYNSIQRKICNLKQLVQINNHKLLQVKQSKYLIFNKFKLYNKFTQKLQALYINQESTTTDKLVKYKAKQFAICCQLSQLKINCSSYMNISQHHIQQIHLKNQILKIINLKYKLTFYKAIQNKKIRLNKTQQQMKIRNKLLKYNALLIKYNLLSHKITLQYLNKKNIKKFQIQFQKLLKRNSICQQLQNQASTLAQRFNVNKIIQNQLEEKKELLQKTNHYLQVQAYQTLSNINQLQQFLELSCSQQQMEQKQLVWKFIQKQNQYKKILLKKKLLLKHMINSNIYTQRYKSDTQQRLQFFKQKVLNQQKLQVKAKCYYYQIACKYQNRFNKLYYIYYYKYIQMRNNQLLQYKQHQYATIYCQNMDIFSSGQFQQQIQQYSKQILTHKNLAKQQNQLMNLTQQNPKYKYVYLRASYENARQKLVKDTKRKFLITKYENNNQLQYQKLQLNYRVAKCKYLKFKYSNYIQLKDMKIVQSFIKQTFIKQTTQSFLLVKILQIKKQYQLMYQSLNINYQMVWQYKQDMLQLQHKNATQKLLLNQIQKVKLNKLNKQHKTHTQHQFTQQKFKATLQQFKQKLQMVNNLQFQQYKQNLVINQQKQDKLIQLHIQKLKLKCKVVKQLKLSILHKTSNNYLSIKQNNNQLLIMMQINAICLKIQLKTKATCQTNKLYQQLHQLLYQLLKTISNKQQQIKMLNIRYLTLKTKIQVTNYQQLNNLFGQARVSLEKKQNIEKMLQNKRQQQFNLKGTVIVDQQATNNTNQSIINFIQNEYLQKLFCKLDDQYRKTVTDETFLEQRQIVYNIIIACKKIVAHEDFQKEIEEVKNKQQLLELVYSYTSYVNWIETKLEKLMWRTLFLVCMLHMQMSLKKCLAFPIIIFNGTEIYRGIGRYVDTEKEK